jgi:ATP-dependent protease HslVU (ClpYQ) peptidase subunit
VTCIVGLVEGNTVFMGGDSAGVAGLDLMVRADQKVFRNGPMLFGFTTSFRMGQLLRYALEVPDHDPRVAVDKWMATVFVDAVRTCLKNHGWASKRDEREHGGTFLVGYQGRLFVVEGDYQVGEPVDGFAAVGCGDQIAHGALFASRAVSGRERVQLALEAAERFSAGVRGPFHLEVLAARTTEAMGVGVGVA